MSSGPASESAAHSSHWGRFSARPSGDELAITPDPGDPNPSPLLRNFTNAVRNRARIARPAVRRGWLEDGPGATSRRGRDEFVELPWDDVLDLLAAELTRIGEPARIYGGSYGWASAGRFHHAQSQVHRFLNTVLGGYVRSVGNYSEGAAAVVMPHVLGPLDDVSVGAVTWEQVATHTDTVLAFGGMAAKNSMVAGGGVSEHVEPDVLRRAHERGTRFVLVSPLRSDLPAELDASWISLVPGTDTALMLGLAHTLLVSGRHDPTFLQRYCTGWDEFSRYLLGIDDAVPKSAAWASGICGVPEADIAELAERLASGRTLITVSHSLQRAEHGEQPVWAAAALAAMLGQLGLPGGGYNYGLGTLAHFGRRRVSVPLPTLPLGVNSVREFIPVARVADMLLNPGGASEFNGRSLHYPDVRLVYWAGGNPFHHHQDLNRLRRAIGRPDTFVVHETAWTATARHADIVLPVTMTLERNDIGAAHNDPVMVAMQRAVAPYESARDDYSIFAALAERMRVADFALGRSAEDWLRVLYADSASPDAPTFDEFWSAGSLSLPLGADDGGVMRAFRADPIGSPLPTPSGRITLYSPEVATFGYDDCPGHPAWLAPTGAPDARHPLWLVANQPATRLHSQLDFGAHSMAAKVHGREVVRLHPSDAGARGVTDGDVVRLFNDRGACLAAARLDDSLRPGVIALPTGAWYDPVDPQLDHPLCVHGNPNVLTRDVGTSRLAQGCTGQLTAVQLERFTDALPPVRAFEPPTFGVAPRS